MKFSARLLFLAGMVLASACKPGVGSSCDKGDARCIDGKRELICQNEKFIESMCRGPGGCKLEGEAVHCDISGNVEGDVCSSDEEGVATCSNGQTLLACRGGKYVAVACRGPNGCEREGDRSRCDQSIATPGDPCDKGDSKACSSDARQVLACQDGKMGRLLECRGQRGCTAVGSKIDCDLSLAMPDDPCEPKLEGHVACTPDSSTIVRCDHGRFTFDERCKKGQKCEVSGSSTGCVSAK